MRSALLSVKGVTRAQVRLEEHEAVVTYDPSQATVEQMITAVSKAAGAGPAGVHGYGEEGETGTQLRMIRNSAAVVPDGGPVIIRKRLPLIAS